MDQRFLTVNALTKYIKRKFDVDPHLQDILVKGEISNFKQHSSGHMYFTLKDEKARILAVMFSSFNKSMKFKPENGTRVLIKGDITVYEPSGQYQIYIKEMQPDGIGDLFLAYEQLKEKLDKEGLFAPHHKKSIPPYPKTIGVITSPTGAAIRDILITIKRRYPIANLLIFPALVQGEQAAPSIAKAIDEANKEHYEIDVLIVGRGGGSIEELWAFNEEVVARAVFASKVPVISAVGHETDFTIADFVADLRAPTPTAAAELAVPHLNELMDRVITRQRSMIRAMKEKVNLGNERLNRIQRSYAFRYPKKLYEQKLEQLDKLSEQLNRNVTKLFELKLEKEIHLEKRLFRHSPVELYKNARQEYERLNKNLHKNMTAILTSKYKEFQNTISTLEALSPLKIMDRGYSLTYTDKGELVKTIEQVKVDDQILVKLVNGDIMCRVTETMEGKK